MLQGGIRTMEGRTRRGSTLQENAQNQILYIRDVFGTQHVDGREQALSSLRNLADEQPELRQTPFLNCCWVGGGGGGSSDYCDAVFEGVRCITGTGRDG